MKNNAASIILTGGAVLIVSVAGLYSIFSLREDALYEDVSYKNEYQSGPFVAGTEPAGESLENKKEETTQDSPEPFVGFSDEDIRKGDVEWQKPEDLGDLGWTDKEVYDGTYHSDKGSSLGVRYVKVGTVEHGKYSGADVLVVLSWIFDDGPRVSSPLVLHYLRWSDKVVYLPYAAARKSSEVLMAKQILGVGAYDSKLTFHIPGVEESPARIEELVSYPDELTGRSDREVFVRNGYSGTAFFSQQGMKPAFEHQEFGTIWMTDPRSDGKQTLALNRYRGWKYVGSGERAERVLATLYYSPVIAGGFYAVRPDGLVESYRLKFDIFDVFDREGLLEATWSDGTRNQERFEEYPGGCGIGAYAYDETGRVAMKDLIVIGKTDTGDDLYGYGSAQNAAVVKMFQEAKAGYVADALAGIDTSAAFLALRPAIFWRDPVGRLLMFKNVKFMPLAECGKPVVYLYPEKTTEVSVKVFPSAGVRISDPDYGDGWNVIAEPNGMLLNRADDKEYGSLFWEGGSDVPFRASEQGFVVPRDGLDVFFDGKLSEFGLIGREISDFKEFWIPKMSESEKSYYFITFLPREQIDQMAPLAIDPKPDTVIRVMMDYEGLDNPKNAEGFRIRTPERRGFTVVEWGGRLK